MSLSRKYIVIEGNIGAGKTTLSQKIACDYNAKMVLETFEDNPFLPKFYKDSERYAFPLELSFLASRYKQLVNEIEQSSLFNDFTISDYYLMKSFIFAKITLADDEFKLYRDFFELVRSLLVKPDVLFYIHRDLDIIKQNIDNRGREYEKDIKIEYLKKISDGYFDYFKEVNDFPIVIVDSNQADFLTKNHYTRFCQLLNKNFKNGITNIKIE